MVTPLGTVSLALASSQQDQERLAGYTTIMDGGANLTALDTHLLQRGSSFVSLLYNNTDGALEAYRALLGAILGNEHPNVINHFDFFCTSKRVCAALR